MRSVQQNRLWVCSSVASRLASHVRSLVILYGVLLSDCYWYSKVTEEYGVILDGEETGLTRLLRNDGKIPAIMQVSQVVDLINKCTICWCLLCIRSDYLVLA